MTTIATGDTHSLYLDISGSVWSCGVNGAGQLGFGDQTPRPKPAKLNLPKIISVSAGNNHSLFLDCNGIVWSCGNNQTGQLGLGDKIQRSTPEKITSLPSITSIFCIDHSSFFLDTTGAVWSCGSNKNGELGLGDRLHRFKPERINYFPKITNISGGTMHSLFLDYSGAVWGSGSNKNFALGSGDRTNKLTPERILGIPTIKAISGGCNFSLMVDTSGYVWTCGSNGKGELGLGTMGHIKKPEKINVLSDIVAISGGWHCFLCLDSKGNLLACGNNEQGQLGTGEQEDRTSPFIVSGLPPIKSLSACNTSNCCFQVVDFEGIVWSCGLNDCGTLGLGDQLLLRLRFFKNDFLPSLSLQSQKVEQVAQDIHAKLEKEIFKSLMFQKSKELKRKINSTLSSNKLNTGQIKEKIVSGVIPMADWLSQWDPIHAKTQQLAQSIEETKPILSEKQQQLQILQNEIVELQQRLQSMEDEKETLDFFDEFLQPLGEIERELRSGFEEKVKGGKHVDFSVDEVSLFLNITGVGDLVEFQRANQFSGEDLQAAISDISVLEVKDTLSKRKLEFHLKVLESGKMMNEEVLRKSAIWRHRDPEKTLVILKEWGVALNEEVLRQKEISICQLIFFKNKDLRKIFGMSRKEAMVVSETLGTMRKDFKKFLNGNELQSFTSQQCYDFVEAVDICSPDENNTIE